MKYKVTAMNIQRFFPNRESNKYKVIECTHESDGVEMKEPQLYRDEVIDTRTNSLFYECRNAYEVEDTYESFWNRLNDEFNRGYGEKYTNSHIVKVLKVVEVQA